MKIPGYVAEVISRYLLYNYINHRPAQIDSNKNDDNDSVWIRPAYLGPYRNITMTIENCANYLTEYIKHC